MSARKGSQEYPPHVREWAGGCAAGLAALVAGTAALPWHGPDPWAAVGEWVPLLGLLGVAAGAAVVLARRSREAAAVVAFGGAALAAWMMWLRGELGLDGGRDALVLAVLFGLPAGVLLLRWGADPFRLLLSGAFGYLALQAIQNDSRFALVAGIVLVWNLGEWAADLLDAMPPEDRRPLIAPAVHAGLLVLLGLWIAAIVTDRHGRWTGEPRRFSLEEQPFEFAHEAIRFAGSPGLPEHALLYELGQTGLYDFYHGPARKPYMDGRLEMPALETFRTYVGIEDWLKEQDPRWAATLDRLGRPLVLLTHQQHFNGEAALLLHPQWHCVYFDALAAVFVPRGSADERAFPTIDFAARHFRRPTAPSVPERPGAAFRELRALANLGAVLRRHREATWTWRIPALLRALDRAPLALQEQPDRAAAAWTLLGNCHWNLVPDLTVPPPSPGASWDPAAALPWAQATYCYRRALDRAPEDATALRFLHDSFRARRVDEAEVEAAIRRFEEEVRRRPISWTWKLAEQVAGTYLHLGRPADARAVWEQAPAPSPAIRYCRLAETHWVERDHETAARLYREALAADSRLGDACWGLAMLEAQRGNAGPALRACRDALRLSLETRPRTDLQALERLIAPLAETPAARP
jgi:tetratricopeptide (TPR) repeat protein